MASIRDIAKMAGSDPMAIGVYNSLATKGLSSPRDISMISKWPNS